MKLFTKVKKAHQSYPIDLYEVKSEDQFLQSANTYGYLLTEKYAPEIMLPVKFNISSRMTIRGAGTPSASLIVQYVGRGVNRGRFGIVPRSGAQRESVGVVLAPDSLEASYNVKNIFVKWKNLKVIDWPGGAPKVYFLSKSTNGSHIEYFTSKSDEEGLRKLFRQITAATDHIDLQWRVGLFLKERKEPLPNIGVLLKPDGTLVKMSELKAVVEAGDYEAAMQMLS